MAERRGPRQPSGVRVGASWVRGRSGLDQRRFPWLQHLGGHDSIGENQIGPETGPELGKYDLRELQRTREDCR